MQRRATKNTRGPNADEKRFQGWVKEQSCIWCQNPGPSIVDHCRGATFKHDKVLIGHWFVIPQCVTCDTQKTIHGKRQGNEAEAWCELINTYCQPENAGKYAVPDEVFASIRDWNK